MMHRIGFASVDTAELPPRGINRKLFDERPHAVQAWLAELPLANLGETGRRVHTTLESLHTIGLTPRQRLDVLGRFEEVVGYLTDGLRKLFLQQSFPLPTRSRNAAELAVKLCEEMAHGYRLILIMDKGGLSGLGGGQRALTSVQACRYTGSALLVCWLLYEKPPLGAWALLHAIWADARRRRILQKKVSLPDGPLRVDSLYKQLLLTEAANPWRMPRGEVLHAHALLSGYAEHAELVPPGSAAATKAVFVVDQKRDMGPGPLLEGARPDGDSALLLVTEGLSRAFDDDARKGPSLFRLRRRPDDAKIERMQRLATALGSIPNRRNARAPGSTGIALVVGLSHAHRALLARHSSDQMPPDATVSEFRSRDLRTDISRQDNDIWELIYSPNTQGRPGAADGPVTEHLVGRPVAPNGPPGAGNSDGNIEHFWAAVNSSDRGYCLSGEPGNYSHSQVGELVLLAETGDMTRPNWQTGVIRWMKRSNTNGTQMGVQIIAPCPHPVFTRAEQPSGRLSDPSRCLLLPAVPDVEQPVTLVTPSLHYSVDRRVYLMGKGQTGELHLTQQVEGTGLFRQFLFRRPGSADPADMRVPDHEALWSSI